MLMLEEARDRGQKAFGETCPQYLVLNSDRYMLEGKEPTKYVLNPPLRDKVDTEQLWQGLYDDVLGVVSSDHCPYRFQGQKASAEAFYEVPNGLPGVETRLMLLHHFGVATGRISLRRMVGLLAESPAKLFGLHPRKGEIRVGADADIVLFDPSRTVTIAPESCHSNTDYTPYDGIHVQGAPVMTILRGETVIENGVFKGMAGQGQFILRSAFSAS